MVTVGELWIYLGFFATLVAAGLGLPLPEEAVISGAGVVAGRLPPEPTTADVPVAYPTPAEVAGLLACNPQAGFPGALPWAALVRSAAPHELAPEDVAAVLAVDPNAGSVGALPWAALARASPPVEQRTIDPPHTIHVRWWILLPACILGVILSDVILYTIGHSFGDWLLKRRWIEKILPVSKRRRTEENFHRYGVGLLVFGRLVPGIRAPLFFTAGSMRLPLPRFLLADGLGAIVGNSLFFFLGFWLGNSIKELVDRAEEKMRPILIVVGIGLLAAYLLWHFLRHPVSTGDPEEVPLIGPQVASHMECPEPPCPPEPCANGRDEKTPPHAVDKPKSQPENRAD